MKLRTGFVSNSSSSSYIIHIITPEEDWSTRFRHFWDYLDGLIDVCSDNSHVEHSSKSSILEEIKTWWNKEDAEKLEAQLKDFKNDSVKEVRISYTDKLLSDLMDYFVKTGDIEILSLEEA